MLLDNDFLEREELRKVLARPGRQLTDRTLLRYEKQGLPYTEVGGRKIYRREALMEWLASREKRKNPPREARYARAG